MPHNCKEICRQQRGRIIAHSDRISRYARVAPVQKEFMMAMHCNWNLQGEGRDSG